LSVSHEIFTAKHLPPFHWLQRESIFYAEPFDFSQSTKECELKLVGGSMRSYIKIVFLITLVSNLVWADGASLLKPPRYRQKFTLAQQEQASGAPQN